MIAFDIPPPNHADPDYTPAGPVMFGGVDATILADPGDEDHRPVLWDWLHLFAFIADNGRELGDRMVSVLIADMEAWRDEVKRAINEKRKAEFGVSDWLP